MILDFNFEEFNYKKKINVFNENILIRIKINGQRRKLIF
jgi:hypothetical protein